MLTKRTLLVLAGLLLITGSPNVFARSQGHGSHYNNYSHHSPRIVFSRPHYYYHQPVVYHWPSHHRVLISPTIVFSSPRPAVTTRQVEVVQSQSVTVWITNDNGSKSAVVLTKETNGPGFRGPRGEYYLDMPTEEQLKMVYGIGTVSGKAASFEVWINNNNGTQTVVTITASGDGFVGPAGEYYAAMPTEEQLKAVYGK